jgi:hypothetical protein
MALPVQEAMLGGAKALLIENWEKADNRTMKSLRARLLTLGMRDAKTGLVLLTKLGIEVSELLSDERKPPLEAPTWKCGHPKIEANTKIIRNGTGTACLKCFQAHNRAYNEQQRNGQYA